MTFPAFAGPSESQAPTDAPGDDEAFRRTEAARGQAEGCWRIRAASRREAERHEIEQPARDRGQQAGNDSALGTSAIGVVARPHARQKRGHETGCRQQANHEGAQAEAPDAHAMAAPATPCR